MVDGGPLAGIRVLEACGWNGVLAGRLLADGGAEVVRVVGPEGDPLDAEPPFFGESGVSIQSAWYNAGKRTVAIDLASEGGREQFLGLVAAADVVIEDWPAPVRSFTHDELVARRPGLVQVSVAPMGSGGPWEGIVTNDLVANALSGAASVTGTAETPPLTGYGNQSHHTVGLYAATCALAALRSARLTGEPQHVELSAHEALVSCTEQVLMQWFFDGSWDTRVAERMGSLHWSRAYEVYPSSTGEGVMVTAALRFVDVLLPWLKEDGAAQDLADEEKYPNILAMIRDLPYVMKVLREWVASKPGEELFYEAQRRHQPFGVVWDVAKALESPQVEARGYLKPKTVPGFGEVPFPGRLVSTSADLGHPGPGVRVAVADLGWTPRGEAAPSGRGGVPSRPLEGVRVMDFTHVLAGPFGTRVLGDLGADVLKIGTAARGAGANTPEHPYYMCWNRNKRSVSINMATEGGRRLARQLASKCDVIIENFSAGVLKRWGLDRASMAVENPGLTVISMGGMGQTGPWKDFVTFAPTIHALTGLTYLTNPPGQHHLGYGFSLTDHLSGLAGAFAALEGVEHRDRTGEGLDIDLAQYELGLGIMAPAYLDYLANGVNPEPVGNRHPYGAWAPYGIYPAAGDDRWVAIAARGDEQWRALCGVMGRDDLTDDHRFVTHTARLANEDALDEEISRWTRGLDRYEVMSRCQDAGVAAGAVQDAEDLNVRDPHLAGRGFFGAAQSAHWGEYGLDRFPARFNGARPPVYEGVHAIGEDTFAVLTEILELGDEEIAALAEEGALS